MTTAADGLPALRVLHVAQPTETGVAEVVLALVAQQVAAGHRVAVACPPVGALAERAERAGAEVRPWPARRQPGPATLGETLRLGRIIAASDPDVVHLHSAKAGLAGRLAVRGRRPTVFQPHAWSFHAVTGPMRRLTVQWERLGARWTDRVLAVSGAEGAEGRAAGVDVAVAIAPNGVDLVRFVPVGPPARLAARASLGLADAPTAVCVGRVCRQKGQDLLVAAWPAVRARVPDAQLVLVGDGPDADAWRSTAGAGVRFAGAQRDVVPWLAAADLAVAPSRWEGHSLALLEAMASGLSVVASDVAGVRESLPATAEAIVPVDAVGPLADAVAARLADPAVRRREGDDNRARVVATSGLDAATARVVEVYREVLRARASA
jgi:glycosyltransferase involved in cell wall biosynthesis